MPRIFGVQSEGSAAVANAYFKGTEVIEPVSAQTIADSISVDLPRDGVRAVRAARQTNGAYITVPDGEILKAIADLGRVGIFAEPAGATAYAGLKKALQQGLITQMIRFWCSTPGAASKMCARRCKPSKKRRSLSQPLRRSKPI